MELALSGLKAGAYSPARKGDIMTDAPTVIGGVLGSGLVVAIATNLLTRGANRKAAEEAAYTARMAEAIAFRDSDRDRLKALEDWRSESIKWQDDAIVWRNGAVRKMEEMRTDKIRLEGVIDALNHQIAADKVLLAQFEQDRITFTTQISFLNEKIASQAAELKSAYERLEAIKAAHAKGEMTSSVLFQRTIDGAEMTILTGAPEELL